MLCTISNFQYNLLWPADQKKNSCCFEAKFRSHNVQMFQNAVKIKSPESEDAGYDRLAVDSFSLFVTLFCELHSSWQFYQINWLWHDKPHWDSISRQGEHYESSKAWDLIYVQSSFYGLQNVN